MLVYQRVILNVWLMSSYNPPPSPQDLRIELVPTARGLVLEDLMREVDDYGEVTGNKAANYSKFGGFGWENHQEIMAKNHGF